MASKEEKVVVKKVQPYPIAVSLQGVEKTLNGAILRLTERGFIMDTKHAVYKVGSLWEVSFELPALHRTISTVCKVMKTYDRFAGPGGAERLAEFHFMRLTEDQRKSIKEFLVKIKQVPRTI